VLERKLAVQQDELRLVEREVVEMLAEYRGARPGNATDSIEAAWREIEAAGQDRPGSVLDDKNSAQSEQRLKDQAVEAQLAFLKRKFGKQR
jgi:hypothetical protein